LSSWPPRLTMRSRRRRRYHHDRFVDRLGPAQPDDAFVEDPGGESQQRQGIDESREHPRAMIAIRLRFIGGLRLEVKSHPSEQQRAGVGEVVPRVGKQGQRVRLDTGDDLDQKSRPSTTEGRFRSPHGGGVRANAQNSPSTSLDLRAYCTVTHCGKIRRYPPFIHARKGTRPNT
jgi:hypothetical protein